ncbi:MAG: response regulator [Myxococcaceae bacterium]
MSSQSTRVLIIDTDTSAAQKVGLALDSAGFPVSWCSFAPSEVAENLKDFRPSLLLVHSELNAPQLATLLARLESTPLPVALLCRDVTDENFVRQLRTGVVELLQEPFSSRLHVNRLRGLISELPGRTGLVQGRGGRELNDFAQHLMRTRRTGGLMVGETGRAFFVRGVLKAARLRELSMQAALAAMTREQSAWNFTEGGGADGAAGLTEFMGEQEQAFVVTYREFGEVKTVVPPLEDAPIASPFGAMAEVTGLPPPPPSAPPPPVVDADAAKTPILFVDDDPTVVTMLSGYFSKKGYPVATASDGLEAMNLLSTRPFEVVIADLNMPRLDGWGLLRMIREDLRTHETPVALFSAQDNYRESLRLVQAGAQAYFPKTIKLSALELQVRELCEPRRRFTRLLASDGGMEFDFGALGPQWVLKALTVNGFTGQVDVRDSWAAWRLWFENGRLVQCNVRMNTTSLSGDRALTSYLTSKSSSGSLSKGLPAPDEGFAGQPTAATLARLVPWLAEEQKRVSEAELARAKALVVNDELYRLFVNVGPPAWQPMVRMLCEQHLTPAEVMARLGVAPMELAAVVKELLRRGVATLQT